MRGPRVFASHENFQEVTPVSKVLGNLNGRELHHPDIVFQLYRLYFQVLIILVDCVLPCKASTLG